MKRFIDNNDGTVTDSLTGLMWSKATTAKNKTHKQAEDTCKKLDLAGHKDWRLPTVEELFLLADRSRISPAIDAEMFPDTENDWYWTRTPSAWASSCAWVVGFYYGYAYDDYRSYKACVRAVRAVPAGQ